VGLPLTYESDDWVVISTDDTSSGIAFQLAPGLRPPHWPDPESSQQVHLDVMVDDVDEADQRVRQVGARRLDHGSTHSHRVYADPAGHPFCLVPRPSWADPITDAPQG
jgi:Glyoxalase-like domain